MVSSEPLQNDTIIQYIYCYSTSSIKSKRYNNSSLSLLLATILSDPLQIDYDEVLRSAACRSLDTLLWVAQLTPCHSVTIIIIILLLPTACEIIYSRCLLRAMTLCSQSFFCIVLLGEVLCTLSVPNPSQPLSPPPSSLHLKHRFEKGPLIVLYMLKLVTMGIKLLWLHLIHTTYWKRSPI